MPKLDLDNIPEQVGTGYPAPFDAPCLDRIGKDLSTSSGLTQFGARLVTLPPGSWSSQRHWHSYEDELVYIISGHPTFVENDGAQTLSPGDITAHPGGDGNAHHLKNETDKPVSYLVIGTRAPEQDHCHYPDIDLDLPRTGDDARIFQTKNGDPY